MLNVKDNDLLTQIEPGAPMNKVMRQYWLPALLSSDAPKVGEQPLRVRLLGEDLLFFKSDDGTLALIGAYCPHRGASLFFGRVEDCGLRCVYHGWKFDAAGNCVDIPNESRAPNLKDGIKHTAYPCVERGGIVWAYMGDQSPAPALPDLEWLGLPEDQVHISIRVQSCNWLQALEGEIDSSHAGFLHSRIDGVGENAWTKLGAAYNEPVFEIEPSDAGIMIAARRDVGDDKYYWRINQFMMPFFTVVPPSGKEPDINGHAWVPIDNQHTLCVMVSYKPDEPYSERRAKLYREGARGREPGHMTQAGLLPFDATKPFGKYWPKLNAENDFGYDYELQKTKYYSGMAGLWPQDAGVQESMGAISDRTREHLGSGDAGIIRVRKLLKNTALALKEKNELHPSMENSKAYRLRSVGITLPRNVEWREAVSKHVIAEGGFDYEMF